MSQVFNFSPGPATLPYDVRLSVQQALMDYNGLGIGVAELSHRSKAFEGILATTDGYLRELLSIPSSYDILFATGGATTQFAMVPLNFYLPGTEANYILSGHWSERALEEGRKFAEVHVAGSSKETGFASLPQSITLSGSPCYAHFTSNNTIYGTQWKSEPDVGAVPLVCDASSDFASRPLDIGRYALLYAGTQKNLGIAGVTLVVVSKEFLARAQRDKPLPVLMSYETLSSSRSLYNTPPTLPIFVTCEILAWIKRSGGIAAIAEKNQQKAEMIYSVIDGSDFYRGTAEPSSRSAMNLTFRLPSEELEEKFIKQAKAEGFVEIKGHRAVGGIRLSMYNAFPVEGAVAFGDFMREFERAQG